MDKLVKHTNEVLLHTGRLQSMSTESEIQARNYMLTGKKSYLEKFHDRSALVIAELKTVKTLTSDNKHIKPALDSATKYAFNRIAFSKQIIALRKQKGLQKAVLLIQTGRGQGYADKADDYIQHIEHNENRLMALRKADSERAQNIMNISLLATVLFITGMIVWLLRKSKKEAAERNLMVAELIKNSERMKTAEKLALLGTWSMDLQTQLVNASDQVYNIWGYDIIDKGLAVENFMHKVHPDDHELISQKVKNLATQNGVESFIFRLVDSRGIKYINNGVTVLRDSHNNVISISGYVQDITEKTIITNSLEDANKDLNIMFKRMGEILYSRDMTKGKFISISDTCELVFGYTAEDFITDPDLWINVVHPDDRHIIQSGNTMLAYGTQIVSRYRIIRKDGGIRWVEKKTVPTLDDKGQLCRINAVINDITERKLASLDREKITADLVARNKTLEQFSYIVSHNLRAPVANIIGLSDVLNNVDNDATEQQPVISHMMSSVYKLDQIVRDLNLVLEVNDHVNEKKCLIEFNELVTGVKTSLSQVMHKKNVHFKLDFFKADHLFSVRNYLHNIFYNIFINSINYSRDDIATIISVESIQSANHVELVFKDNGKGIDLERNGSTLFDLYRRFDFSVKGKGMGLFMVKTQVEALGGTINVKSAINKGTEFHIILPDNEKQPEKMVKV
ncbi:MAG: PAS domain S-box protein [Sphingobacteriales bacterium]|nr:MAG: PAS domain S-box protein [Sphingobacteriales bacterium]